jgi:hypothetical protein
MSAKVDSRLHCTFCDKVQTEVRKLIAGPGVYICDECIGLCNGILDDEDMAPSATRPADLVSDATLLAHLTRLTSESDELVHTLRERGVAWEDIARALRPPDA